MVNQKAKKFAIVGMSMAMVGLSMLSATPVQAASLSADVVFNDTVYGSGDLLAGAGLGTTLDNTNFTTLINPVSDPDYANINTPTVMDITIKAVADAGLTDYLVYNWDLNPFEGDPGTYVSEFCELATKTVEYKPSPTPNDGNSVWTGDSWMLYIDYNGDGTITDDELATKYASNIKLSEVSGKKIEWRYVRTTEKW